MTVVMVMVEGRRRVELSMVEELLEAVKVESKAVVVLFEASRVRPEESVGVTVVLPTVTDTVRIVRSVEGVVVRVESVEVKKTVTVLTVDGSSVGSVVVVEVS